MATRQRLPDGWKRITDNDYCIRNGDFTICKIGGAEGWRYELWQLRDQLSVNLLTLEAAIEAWREVSALSA